MQLESIQKFLERILIFGQPTICENCDCHVFHQYVIEFSNGKRWIIGLNIYKQREFHALFIIQFRYITKKRMH